MKPTRAERDYVERKLIEAFRVAYHFPTDRPRPPGALWPDTLREFSDLVNQTDKDGKAPALRTSPPKPNGAEIDDAERTIRFLFNSMPKKQRLVLSGGAQLADFGWKFAKLAKDPQMRRAGFYNRNQIKEAYYRALEQLTERVYG